MTKEPLVPSVLAQEFGVSEAGMAAFINRFSPAHVAEGTFKSDADTMLFVHIPKTAGVSLGRSFRQAFDKFHSVQWNDVARTFRNATRIATYDQSKGGIRQVIMGHYGWPELQIWRNHELPMKCGTILRDPVERVVSNYNYNSSDAHPGREDFQARFPTLESYIINLGNDVQLSQALGFIDSFETALRKFTTHYTFLGTTEKLSASLAHLGRSHGLPKMKEFRENVGKVRQKSEIPSDLRRLVEDRSHNDRKMHQLLMRIYGTT